MVTVNGRQLCGSIVVAKSVLRGACIPGPVNNSADVGGIGNGRTIHKSRGGGNFDDGLQRFHAVVGSISAVHGNQLAFIVGIKGQFTTGAKEESCLIPAGVDFHVKILSGSFAVGKDLFQRSRISNNRLVIVEEVTVIGGHRISIHGIAESDSGNGTGIICGLNNFCVFRFNIKQGTGSHKAGQLVLCKTKDIGSGFHIGNDVACGIALTNRFNDDIHAGIFRVCSFKGFHLFFREINNIFCNPNLDIPAVISHYNRCERQQHG